MNHRHLLGLLALVSATGAATAQWSTSNVSPRPWARVDGQMAYDAARGQMILFGGFFLPSSFLADTWAFDGARWTQLRPTSRPIGRGKSQMVFDSSRNVIVMYGGSVLGGGPWGGTTIGDTWEWGGTNWTQVQTAASPGNLAEHAMAFDSARNRVVLFGGASSLGLPWSPSGATWEYDGVNWQPIPVAGPGARRGPSMCFDPGIGKTVLFGGIDANYNGMPGTWLWDGATWTRWAGIGFQPGHRYQARMTYDATRGHVLLQGGLDGATGAVISDSWAFDGTTWTLLETGRIPTHGGALAYDSARSRPVMFGGATRPSGSTPAVSTDAMWEYGPVYNPFGTGCTGSNGAPTLSSTGVPTPGVTLHVTVTNLIPVPSAGIMMLGFSDAISAFGPLPVDLTPLGMNGCTLYVDPMLGFTIPFSGGVANFGLPIPADPALFGVEFFNQFISPDFGVNPFGFVVSNAAKGVIGF